MDTWRWRVEGHAACARPDGMSQHSRPIPFVLAVGCWLAASSVCPAALAQFKAVPTPLPPSTTRASEAESELEYRLDAARRIYESFPMHIFRGKLPPLMHAIAITETDVDADGRVLAVRLVREPAAAKEVGPWVMSLIRRVGQFPRLARMPQATYTDIWLVDKSGRFQLDTLTEGQLGEEEAKSSVKVLGTPP
jgi:periplasmic protein TonB